jgi:hypothetical protein
VVARKPGALRYRSGFPGFRVAVADLDQDTKARGKQG